jgi:hypothetical protein
MQSSCSGSRDLNRSGKGLKEERSWKMFENKMLRKIFGSKREGVTRGWRKLHSDSHCLHPYNMLGWLNQGE